VGKRPSLVTSDPFFLKESHARRHAFSRRQSKGEQGRGKSKREERITAEGSREGSLRPRLTPLLELLLG